MKRRVPIRTTPIYGNHTIRIQFGDLCCALICHDTDIFGRLKELYDIFRSDEPADLSIKLEVVDRLSFNEVKAALCQTKLGTKENTFIAMEPTLDGEFDTTNCAFSMTVEKHLFDPILGFRLMNQLLCRAYHTASQRAYNGSPVALIVHSCGILRNGQVMLFAGPCKTGKTTIARLCDEEHGQVLNDEMVLIYPPNQASGTCKVQGVPIIGGVPWRLNAVAPLRCVLLLKQSNRTAVRRLDRLEAYLRLMRQVISPVYWGQIDYRTLVLLIDEFCDEVTRTTPFYELEFTLDKELLWKIVGELEETLGKEEQKNLKDRLDKAKDIIWRRIGDDIVVLKHDGRSVHVLNKTTAFIWELCDGECGIDEITVQLCERFDVSPEEARADVSEMIERLTQVGIINQLERKQTGEAG